MPTSEITLELGSSSLLTRLDYDPENQQLVATFRNSRRYRYFDVGEMQWSALHKAYEAGESVGKVFVQFIRNGNFAGEEIIE